MPSISYLLVYAFIQVLNVFLGWYLNTLYQIEKNDQKDIKINIKKSFLLSHKLSRLTKVLNLIYLHYRKFRTEEGIVADREYVKTIQYKHIDNLKSMFTLKLVNDDLVFKLKRLEAYIECADQLTKSGLEIDISHTLTFNNKEERKNFYEMILNEREKVSFGTYNKALGFFIEDLTYDMKKFLNSPIFETKSCWKKIFRKIN